MEEEKIHDESTSSDNDISYNEVQHEPDISTHRDVKEGARPDELSDSPDSEAAEGSASASEEKQAEVASAEELKNGLDPLDGIHSTLDGIEDTERRIFSEVREMHKLYHTEFAGRLKSMQDELDQYRKIDKGRAYDDILAAIARIYGNNETLADEVAEPKAKKSIRYMLLDLEDLLGVYGMSKLRSSPGERRNPKHCQILNRVPTDDPAKHDTVAKSYNSGFYIGNRTVIKELIDIFFYEELTARTDAENNPTDETAEVSDSE